MLKKISMFIVYYILAIPLLSYGFDCNKPDFGAKLEDINKDGYFVKYMEKAGISYYNYTGPCRMEVHNNANPSISFAFIEDRLYARISRLEITDPIKSISRMEERVFKQIGDSKLEKRQEGDWSVYQWYNEKDQLKYKVKYHNLSNLVKTAFYYEPLRAKLPNLKEDDDPVFLRH
jgi:hypothetical protein